MRLQLERPLAFIDLESTGTSPERDRIVEIAVLRLQPDGSEDVRCHRMNPGIPIPADATAVHGITDADVADEPPFASCAKALYTLLDRCDFAGFGIRRFDLPLLRAEFRRCGGMAFSWRGRAVIDAMAIFHNKHPRDLAAAVQLYCGREFPQAHSAMNDVRATRDVLLGQLIAHPELPSSVDQLHSVCNDDDDCVDLDGKLVWVDGEATFAFGEHKGESLKQVTKAAPDYLGWMLRKDFDFELKEIIQRALGGDFPAR